MTIQEKLTATVCRILEDLASYRTFAETYPNASPALCQALADVCGLNAATFAMKTPAEIDALAGEQLGFSRVHCTLIRLSDMADAYGGLAYLDTEPEVLKSAAAPLIRFWFVLEALDKTRWEVIDAGVPGIRYAPACQRVWAQSASAARKYLPEEYLLAGLAVIESLTRGHAEPGRDGVLAAHRATIEIIAASSGAALPLNYLGLFGFNSIEQLLAVQLCEP